MAVKLNVPGSAYYSISQLPTVLSWGPGNGTSVSTDDSRFIIQAGMKVRVLIIGEVTKAFLRGTTTNRGSCSLNIAPIFPAEAERLDNLVKGFSTSSKSTCITCSISPGAHPFLVKAVKSEDPKSGFMVSNSIGVVCPFVLPPLPLTLKIMTQDAFFQSIYDARARFGNKADMPTLKTNQIAAGDIVCVEAYIQRYVHFDDHSKPRDGWLWNSIPFRVGLQLRAVSLIATPRDIVEEDDGVDF